MRLNMFRGKRKSDGEWVKGYYLKADTHWHDNGIHEDWIVCGCIQNGGFLNIFLKHAVIADTVGEYTGRMDKNNQRVFEGDIVRVHDRLAESTAPFHEFVGFVDYQDNAFVIVTNDWIHRLWMNYEIEVIGNIYDNPELLIKTGCV